MILAALHDLPQSVVASEVEVVRFIDMQKLYGLGIGHVDAHLLASARLTAGGSLWTRDKRLHAVADRLGLATVLSG
jgi:predicted nucleic acid-binding protein